MELHFTLCVTAALFLLLLIRLLQIYWSFRKKTSGFPFYNLVPYILYCHITGKITKNTPTLNVAFERLIEMGKQCWKEGLFMTYFTQPVLFIYSEEAIKVFTNEKAAIDKSPDYKIIGEDLGEGLLVSNGERWKKHRKLINPAFHMGMIKEKVPFFNIHALNLVADLETLVGKQSVDILDNLKLHYYNVLCESVLGVKQDEEKRARNMEDIECVDHICYMMVKRCIYPWLRPKFMLKFFPFGRTFIQKNKICNDHVKKIISKMKENTFSNNNVEGSDLRKSYSYILLNQHSIDPTFTADDILSEVKTIITTGYDTVTISTMWCLYLLGLHPEIQEKVYNEIQMITSEHVTYEETVNLAYLEAVINESQRLYPTVPIFYRNLSKDINCGKYKVLKGTTIAFFAYLSHRNPEIYPDPEKFKPERFLNGEIKKAHGFIPFSEGSRSCIGKNYAKLEMKIFLSHILRNFKITSFDRREDLKLCYKIDLLPNTRLRYKIERRQNIPPHLL